MNAANKSMCYIIDEQLLYIYLCQRNHATEKNNAYGRLLIFKSKAYFSYLIFVNLQIGVT